MSPVFDRHEVTITERPAGERFTHQATCDCNWQGLADSESDAEGLAIRHQASRGYVAQDGFKKGPSAAERGTPPSPEKAAGLPAATAAPANPVMVPKQVSAPAKNPVPPLSGVVSPPKPPVAQTSAPKTPDTPKPADTPKTATPVVQTPVGVKPGDKPVTTAPQTTTAPATVTTTVTPGADNKNPNAPTK